METDDPYHAQREVMSSVGPAGLERIQTKLTTEATEPTEKDFVALPYLCCLCGDAFWGLRSPHGVHQFSTYHAHQSYAWTE